MKQKLKSVLLLLILAAVVLWFFTALGDVRQGADRQAHHQLEQALRRGAVACYASEGFYPPSLDYLCSHYGVHIDESRYVVFYEVEAENLMPHITVLERTK